MSLLIVIVSAVTAQVFTWTDKAGVVHYTDNPSAVPADVKPRVTEGAEISLLTTDQAPRPVRARAEQVIDARAAAVAELDRRDEQRRSEREWRAAFRELNERIAGLTDEIEIDRRKVEDVNGLPASARFTCLNPFGWNGWGPQPYLGQTTVMAGGQLGTGVAVGGSVVVRQTGPVVYSTPASAPCVLAVNPEYERAKERLELNRKVLARANEELADLERRASFEGVPREWRR